MEETDPCCRLLQAKALLCHCCCPGCGPSRGRGHVGLSLPGTHQPWVWQFPWKLTLRTGLPSQLHLEEGGDPPRLPLPHPTAPDS